MKCNTNNNAMGVFVYLSISCVGIIVVHFQDFGDTKGYKRILQDPKIQHVGTFAAASASASAACQTAVAAAEMAAATWAGPRCTEMPTVV